MGHEQGRLIRLTQLAKEGHNRLEGEGRTKTTLWAAHDIVHFGMQYSFVGRSLSHLYNKGLHGILRWDWEYRRVASEGHTLSSISVIGIWRPDESFRRLDWLLVIITWWLLYRNRIEAIT